MICPDADGKQTLFPAYYSSSCGGHTENSRFVFGDQVPALEGVSCPYCRETTRSEYYYWSGLFYSKEEINRRLMERYPSLATLETIDRIEPARQSEGERITLIRLIGKNGNIGFSEEKISAWRWIPADERSKARFFASDQPKRIRICKRARLWAWGGPLPKRSPGNGPSGKDLRGNLRVLLSGEPSGADNENAMNAFDIKTADNGSSGRVGALRTGHGTVQTPAFMPVGTRGCVKGILPDQLRQTGAQIMLANTYHLLLRPGVEVVVAMGGLHRFTGWDGPILTDSGGFQVFSLSSLNRVDEDGVEFASHIDGSPFRLDAKTATGIQNRLGADIIMCFDECTPYPCEFQKVEQAVERTIR